jgi:phenylalanyl-tRNA synthetase beta chain
VLLEAANFEPLGILRTSERLALRTAGSNRWEKGVDPYLAENAAILASRMLVDLAGARMTGHVDVQEGLPERPVVRFRPERASKLIGLEVPAGEQRALLEALGFDISDDWAVTVPTWRARDVTREVDVIEEVARPLLDRVPYTLPLRRQMHGRLSKEQRLRRVVEDALVGAGLSEAYTWSLVASDPDPEAIRLPSPMTSDQAILRTRIVPGLIEAARTGVDAGAGDVALFEIARVYLPSGEQLPIERWRVAQQVASRLPGSIGEGSDLDLLVYGDGDVLQDRGEREHVFVDDPLRHGLEQRLEVELERAPHAFEQDRVDLAEPARLRLRRLAGVEERMRPAGHA